jgi:hypothetical protein
MGHGENISGMPAGCNEQKNQKFVQLWHALNIVKKFGYSALDKPWGHKSGTAKAMCMHRNYTHIVACSEHSAKVLCECFNATDDKAVLLPLPRAEYIIKSPENRDAIEKEYQATYVSLEQLMKTSDFVSLHTPLTSQTHHLIGKKELALCKPTAYLINTARGAVVHEEALIEALQQEMIAGAALDVYEFEPQVSDSLRCLTNVLLVPHIGTATRETRNHMAAMALQNVVEYFNGNPVRVVNP